jgi:hypothetical protein
VFDSNEESKIATFECNGKKTLKIKHFAFSAQLAHKVIHSNCAELYPVKQP